MKRFLKAEKDFSRNSGEPIIAFALAAAEALSGKIKTITIAMIPKTKMHAAAIIAIFAVLFF